MTLSIIYLFYLVGVTVFTICLHFLSAICYFEQCLRFDPAPSAKVQYEVIIVGAGTAGSTILSGIDAKDVLVIEAGLEATSPASASFSSLMQTLNDIPIATPVFQQQTSYDWQFQTIPQDDGCWAMNYNISYWPMGRGFGGSQLINNMIYVRGHEDDYIGWFSSRERYSYSEHILPYFRKFESHITLNELKFKTKLASIFMKSAEEFGYDTNAEFIHPKVMQNNGKRCTVAKSLFTNSRREGDFHFEFQAEVDHIIFERGDEASLKATGVVFLQDGKYKTVHATKAVILAAGTIGSPTILLKSGVGSPQNYEGTDLKLLHNLPAVGKHLQDHVTSGLDLILLNDTLGLEPWNIYSFSSLKDYLLNGIGPLTMTGCEVLGFVRSSIAQRDTNCPDLGFMVVPLGATIDGGVHMKRIFNLNETVWTNYFEPLTKKVAISIMPVVLHPKSSGSVTIAMDDNNKWKPLIDAQYLSHPDDVKLLIEGLRIIEQLLKMPALKNLNAEINPKPFPGCEKLSFGSHSYWECYVRHLTLTAYHPVGTCRMGNDQHDSVVKSDTFQVHGIENLFICDASIMPSMPSGNPQATVGMLAWRFLDTFGKGPSATKQD